jgi:hypothetical protein
MGRCWVFRRQRANVQSMSGDVLVNIVEDDGNFVYPRGRYAIMMYASFFRIRGARFDHKVTYDDIVDFFLLPKPDNRSFLVVRLNKPIRQGQQRYHFLVLNTSEVERTFTVNLSEVRVGSSFLAGG